MPWVWALPILPFAARWAEGRGLADVVLSVLLAGCAFVLTRQARKLESMAVRDALTGLYNRWKFDEDLQREVARARRMGMPLSLVFVDVDHFKRINDTRGHLEGDRILRQVAKHLDATVRGATDGCYRIGGDEFAVLLPGAASGEEFERRLRAGRPGAEISVGMVRLEPGEGPEAFFHRADARMYAVKQETREAARNGS